MGIPSYFSYVIKKHSNILTKINNHNIIHNLYLDCNSIIYDSLRNIKYENNHDFENKLLKEICKKIHSYINIVKPQNNIFIAFDGVAPIAKLDQQRNRRYKSWFQEMILNQFKDANLHSLQWDKTAITPGTKFMYNLSIAVHDYFKNPKSFKVNNIIISTSDEEGEGEHKIYEYIRQNSEHKDQVTYIYGLDADLIMLTLNHLQFCKKMFLFRETPEFIKNIDSSLNPNSSYVMDIPQLGEAIMSEMIELQKKENKGNIQQLREKKLTKCLSDYIFLCFMLGNDFMPHFPALNIRTNGMNYLLEAYKNTVGNTLDYLTTDDKINWKIYRRFIQFLAVNEHKYLKNEYKIREKWEKRRSYNNTKKESYYEDKLLSLPVKEREIEKYINPSYRFWENRYYDQLFNIQIDDVKREEICINYLEALEWTFNYYTKGCIDWRWHYKYNYPPLLVDLIKYIPYFDTVFVEKKLKNPVTSHTQLAYVLPRNSLSLLPKDVYEKLIDKFDEKYSLECDFKWSFCKYFWEAHVDLPIFNINEIEELIYNK